MSILLLVLLRTCIKVLTEHIVCTGYYFLKLSLCYSALPVSPAYTVYSKLSIKPVFCFLLLSGEVGSVYKLPQTIFTKGKEATNEPLEEEEIVDMLSQERLAQLMKEAIEKMVIRLEKGKRRGLHRGKD